jgi:TRAP transporter TAXI family solute receptor
MTIRTIPRRSFVTSTNVDDDLVYALAKMVFENLEEFKSLHPAYASLTPENMLQGLTAPVHPGAMKYYREAGLDRFINEKLILDQEL